MKYIVVFVWFYPLSLGCKWRRTTSRYFRIYDTDSFLTSRVVKVFMKLRDTLPGLYKCSGTEYHGLFRVPHPLSPRDYCPWRSFFVGRSLRSEMVNRNGTFCRVKTQGHPGSSVVRYPHVRGDRNLLHIIVDVLAPVRDTSRDGTDSVGPCLKFYWVITLYFYSSSTWLRRRLPHPLKHLILSNFQFNDDKKWKQGWFLWQLFDNHSYWTLFSHSFFFRLILYLLNNCCPSFDPSSGLWTSRGTSTSNRTLSSCESPTSEVPKRRDNEDATSPKVFAFVLRPLLSQLSLVG